MSMKENILKKLNAGFKNCILKLRNTNREYLVHKVTGRTQL